MKFKSVFCLLMSTLLLSSCIIGKTSSETSSGNTSSTSSETSSSEITSGSSETSDSSTSDSTSQPEGPQVQTFYHKFTRKDFTQSGGEYDINGLHWSVDAFSAYGAGAHGLQIGSKSNPQRTPWNFSTTFNGEIVTLLDFTAILTNGNDGGGTYTVSSDAELFSGEFSIPNDPKPFEHKDINADIDKLTFTLQATKSAAIYLYSITFSVLVAEDSNLDITSDYYDAQPVVPGQNGIPEIAYQPTTLQEYYSDVDLTATGDVLVNDLREKISIMTKRSYGDAKTMLIYIDENPDKPGYLYGFYDGDDILPIWDSGSSWNREHVWACSQMNLTGTARPTESTKNHTSDLHNLRVACTSANGFHGNKFYDETQSSLAMFPNLTKEDMTGIHNYTGDFRGDVARILFYMYVRYEGLVLNDELDVNNNVSMGKLSALIEWNKEDPVDDFEIQRNNRVFAYQGNRNPFIDYPNLADQIF